jgi:hypothetical protein
MAAEAAAAANNNAPDFMIVSPTQLLERELAFCKELDRPYQYGAMRPRCNSQ